jgi:putative endopeptidase
MDESAVNGKGAEPIKPWLNGIAAVQDKKTLAREMGRLQQFNIKGLFRSEASTDDKDPATNAMHIRQAGLGMPTRDYYLKKDPKTVALRAAYLDYLGKLFTLAGENNPEGRARAVLAFETRIAEVQWDAVSNRDSDKTYNRWSAADFSVRASGFDWNAYFGGLGAPTSETLIVLQPSAFAGEARIWNETPLSTLKDWLALRTLDRYSSYLSEPFVAANFTYSGKALNGVGQIRPRWLRGVRLVGMELRDEVGAAFIAHYFSLESKTAAEKIAANIQTAFAHRLAEESWMTPETKTKALAKLAAIKVVIGFPDAWRDDTGLEIRRDDLFGNVARAEKFDYQANLAKAGKPAVRGGDWGMPVTAAGGEAFPSENVLIIPAGLLQPPVFDVRADPAVNYGAIGIIIGHEFSHFFDDQGRRYDASGSLTDWWTPQDVAKFTALTQRLIAQYDAYEPTPGLHVNGRLTLGENIADLAGLLISHDAYLLSLHDAPPPVLDGLSGDQRFYLGQAQLLREKERENNLRNSLLEDPHTPPEQRVLEDRNLDSWYSAFGVKAGETLYLPPEQRVHIW